MWIPPAARAARAQLAYGYDPHGPAAAAVFVGRDRACCSYASCQSEPVTGVAPSPPRQAGSDGQGRRLPAQQEPALPSPAAPRPHLHPGPRRAGAGSGHRRVGAGSFHRLAGAGPFHRRAGTGAGAGAAAGPHLRRVLLHVRPGAAAGARGATRGGVRAGRAGDPAPRAGDPAPRRAGPDGRAGGRRGDGRGGDPRGGPRRPPRRRRLPLRLPRAVRRHGRADAGLLRLHRAALPRPAPRRQACRLLRQHRYPVRRPRDHRVDGDNAAGAPRHAVRAHRVHLRRRDVRDGGAPRGLAVRRRGVRRRRLQAAQRAGAGPRRAPRQVHGHAGQEDGARRRCLIHLADSTKNPSPCRCCVVLYINSIAIWPSPRIQLRLLSKRMECVELSLE